MLNNIAFIDETVMKDDRKVDFVLLLRLRVVVRDCCYILDERMQIFSVFHR